jgi:subfamily B ATP-binding cassette protein MsbA
MQKPISDRKGFKITRLLRPHLKLLTIGFIGVLGEGLANLLEPWPLKVVLDNVLKSKPAQGWLNAWILSTFGDDKLGVLKFAALAVLAIAIVGAGCSYVEKYVTTSVGQWVTHDLRRTLYSHIRRLSLAYHDHKRTGDLISRVTGDIDAIQKLYRLRTSRRDDQQPRAGGNVGRDALSSL